jgi:hypothetical protein
LRPKLRSVTAWWRKSRGQLSRHRRTRGRRQTPLSGPPRSKWARQRAVLPSRLTAGPGRLACLRKLTILQSASAAARAKSRRTFKMGGSAVNRPRPLTISRPSAARLEELRRERKGAQTAESELQGDTARRGRSVRWPPSEMSAGSGRSLLSFRAPSQRESTDRAR